MRRDLVLGGLVSVGFHLAAFLAPWTPMPKTEILWTPKPEMEVSFASWVQKEEPFRQESSLVQPAASQQEPEALPLAPKNPEPAMPKKEKPASIQHFSKPKVKPRPEGKKQLAEAQETSFPEEEISGAHVALDSASASEITSTRSEEIRSVPDQVGKSTGPGLSSGKEGFLKAQLKKALPRYGSNPKPHYPEAARRRGYEGTVILSVVVLKDGSAGSVQIAKGSGYKMLDDAAREAVARWKFMPALLGEEPVEMQVEIPILFKLE